MLISTELAIRLFATCVHNFFVIFGMQIWRRDSSQPTFHLSVFALFWSFFVFGVIAFSYWFVDFDYGLSILELYKTEISIVGDAASKLLHVLKVPVVFLPVWVMCLKKKQFLQYVQDVRRLLMQLNIVESFYWELLVVAIVLHLLYAVYMIGTIYQLVKYDIITLEDWHNAAMTATILTPIVFTCVCVFELSTWLAYIALRLNDIARRLRDIDCMRLPYLE